MKKNYCTPKTGYIQLTISSIICGSGRPNNQINFSGTGTGTGFIPE